MIKKGKRILIPLLIVLVLITTGCSFDSLDKLWVKSEGWSRALKLGETGLAGPAPGAVDQNGNLIFTLFPRLPGEEQLFKPQLVMVDDQGLISKRVNLDLQIAKPADADFLLHDQSIELFWVETGQLMTAPIDLDGQLLSEPVVLSGEERVSSFFVDQLDGRTILTYSGSRDRPGVYAVIEKNGSFERTQLDEGGMRVNQYLDPEGRLHLVWIRYPSTYGELEIFYLETDPFNIQTDDKLLMHIMNVTPAVRITGPALGFDQNLGYIFWSRSIVSGVDVGVQTSYIQYFPTDRPDQVRPPFPVSVPFSQNLTAEEYYGAFFDTGPRVSMGGPIPRIPYQDSVSTLPGSYPELAIAFRSRSEHKWRDVRPQVNVAYLENGLLTTYQPLSYTSTESSNPQIFQDQEGRLYVSWLEKSNGVLFAYISTTDPVRKANLDLVSTEDYLYLAAEGVFGVLAGAVLSPFAAAVWGGAGLLGLLIHVLLGLFNQPVLRRIGELLGIAAGVYIYWWIKFATLPGLDDGYVPFSAWVPRLPPTWEQPLVIGIPILIGLVSAYVAYMRTYGRDSGSPINFHLIYAGVDALFSCAIYGILIYGAF